MNGGRTPGARVITVAGDGAAIRARTLSRFRIASPRGEAWNPPRHFSAERFILGSKTRSEGGLLVNQNEHVKQQPDKAAVFKQRDVSEKQTLTENRDRHCYLHWITHITIQTGNYQMTGWENRRRCAHALKSESDERIQEANDSQSNQHAPANAEEPRPQEWSFDPPMGDPPGHQAGYESGGNDQEDGRADNRQHLPHHALI